MGATYPSDIIDQLNAIPIEDVAQWLGIDVRRGHRALCFIHDDHHPSLFFNVRRNNWRCFACDHGGSVIDLVKAHEDCGFSEACAMLAEHGGITLPDARQYKTKESKRKPIKSSKPKGAESHERVDKELLSWVIDNSSLTKEAKKFLFSQRKYSEDVVAHLHIGSISDGWRFAKAVIDQFGKERAEASQMVRSGERGSYSVFATPCIIFPYYNKDGEVVSIQSRYLGKEDKPRFQFAAGARPHIFNIPILARLKDSDELYITEGVTDCIALLSDGRNAVAIPSATTQPVEELLLLKGHKLIMYPDNDVAGQKGYIKLLIAISQNIHQRLHKATVDKVYKDYSDYYIANHMGKETEVRGADTTQTATPAKELEKVKAEAAQPVMAAIKNEKKDILPIDYVIESVIDSMDSAVKDDSTYNDLVTLFNHVYASITIKEDDLKLFSAYLSANRQFQYNRSFLYTRSKQFMNYLSEFSKFVSAIAVDFNKTATSISCVQQLRIVYNDFIQFSKDTSGIWTAALCQDTQVFLGQSVPSQSTISYYIGKEAASEETFKWHLLHTVTCKLSGDKADVERKKRVEAINGLLEHLK